MSRADSPSLAVTLAGVKMRAPVGIGAIGFPLIEPRHLTPEMHTEVLLKHVDAGAGFICLPLSAHVPDEMLADLEKKARPFDFSWEPAPAMFLKIDTPGFGAEGVYLFGSPGIPPKRLARRFKRETLKMIETLKQKKPKDVPIIANIAGLGAFPETFITVAKACEEAGVELIELNLSCPMAVSLEEAPQIYSEKDFPLTFAGLLLGDQPNLAREITREVVQAVNIPVGVKISPETGFPRIIELAREIKQAGAKFINCGNMGITIAPPDIYNGGKPKWPVADGNPFVSAGGSWLRMIVYKQVAAIAKFVPGIDIIATGGLMVPEHLVEAMMLGAKATQVVTGMLYHGRDMIRKDVQFLRGFLEEQGYRSVEELIGLGLKYIKPGNKIEFKYGKFFAEVDLRKCTGCGICTDHICLASYMENGTAKVKVDDCIGCGMCVALCPQGAVSLRERS